ncbi:TetR/AcrR family transcriptional regulator [Curtobacterium sp. A7_M15]|uniref:TetR/AcrR family transcriptional regulator n=1 Tax=Curtobacterium sp. A7_M15 TaxID=3065241 RepID=UPI002737A341|nr:TetR/AcrR family transcriptional regulator [Curtobacterium sp. A7_M15]MDP4332206.1 TetR/AcrR family transcriptional regulator [Curtobacterium sp. A7_M15]
MSPGSARDLAMDETRNRILDVARELLGRRPDAGMGEVAQAAGVVRRTVYGHFPARSDLVRTLAERAGAEIGEILEHADVDGSPADAAWARFVTDLWPLAHRYRVLLALRRGQQGDEIHAVLGAVDRRVAELVQRGQDDDVFGRHLPAITLGQIASATVFTIADEHRVTTPGAPDAPDARAAVTTSLLVLGVPAARALELGPVSA